MALIKCQGYTPWDTEKHTFANGHLSRCNNRIPILFIIQSEIKQIKVPVEWRNWFCQGCAGSGAQSPRIHLSPRGCALLPLLLPLPCGSPPLDPAIVTIRLSIRGIALFWNVRWRNLPIAWSASATPPFLAFGRRQKLNSDLISNRWKKKSKCRNEWNWKLEMRSGKYISKIGADFVWATREKNGEIQFEHVQ